MSWLLSKRVTLPLFFRLMHFPLFLKQPRGYIEMTLVWPSQKPFPTFVFSAYLPLRENKNEPDSCFPIFPAAQSGHVTQFWSMKCNRENPKVQCLGGLYFPDKRNNSYRCFPSSFLP